MTKESFTETEMAMDISNCQLGDWQAGRLEGWKGLVLTETDMIGNAQIKIALRVCNKLNVYSLTKLFQSNACLNPISFSIWI
ncbi:hypothetical protein BHYA_0292g00090 [Botrytis hyacinthi]|uniref:Uncharacterized protein n=1 Tax=Botrytis hyacinthi TaxID=278943 RepID=A0A4Z1GBB3_9HELO|nr:hypothetical protein BHYA_0292g00090 [Botrytis hyacinthi]